MPLRGKFRAPCRGILDQSVRRTSATWCGEAPAVRVASLGAGPLAQIPAAFMHGMVVREAEQGHIAQRRLAAVPPVHHVVGLAPGRVDPTAWKAAVPIAHLEGAPEVRRRGAEGTSEIQDVTPQLAGEPVGDGLERVVVEEVDQVGAAEVEISGCRW